MRGLLLTLYIAGIPTVNEGQRMAEVQAERIANMDKEILDVAGAARVLGVYVTTVYALARKGEIPATRIGREWRSSPKNLIQWVTNGTQVDQIRAALRNAKG
jgi:excisionase family DNA binding protein